MPVSSVSQFAIQQLLSLLTVFAVMPAVGGTLLYKGFCLSRTAEELAWSRCFKAILAATGCAYLGMALFRFLSPETITPGWVAVAATAAVEFALLVVFLRRTEARALLIQASAVLLMNAAVYGLMFA